MSTDAVHITGIILAAGKGTRMQSPLPKVLHQVAGTSMLEHVYQVLEEIPLHSYCLILNEQLAPFQDFMTAHPQAAVCIQHKQNGTGSAVASAAPVFSEMNPCSFASSSLYRGTPVTSSHSLICAGDSPALESSSLRNFIADCLGHKAKIGLLAMEVAEPTGYGRLVFSGTQRLEKIVEEKDATAAQKTIRICNTGIIFAETDFLFSLLQHLTPHNAQGEYYLTDCFAAARQKGVDPHVFIAEDYRSYQGVNTPEQLAEVEAYMASRASVHPRSLPKK